MTRLEKSELVGSAVRQLAGDDRFQLFMEAIEEMKVRAMRQAVSDESLSNLGTTAAALGEARAYMEIQDIVEENKPDDFI